MGILARTSPLGVDLGGGSIKVVQLRGKKVTLAAYRELDESVLSDEASLIRALRAFFDGLSLSGKPAIIHLPGSMTFVRTLAFPPMPLGELRDAVRWEVKRQLPYALQEAVYDFVAVNMGENIAVTFVSAERRSVLRYVLPFREAGLSLAAVDAAPLCLIRALAPKSPGNTVMLDIGKSNTEISIIKGGVLRLTRAVDIGSGTILRQIEGQGVEHGEAVRILATGGEAELKGALDELLKETLRSMDFYKASFKEKAFSGAMLAGGLAINPYLREFLAGALEIDVSVPDPFAELSLSDPSLRAVAPRFALALGLARRAA